MFENLKKEENNIDDIFAETDKSDDLSSVKPEASLERPGTPSAGQPLMSKPDIQGERIDKKSGEDFSDFSDDDSGPKKTLKKLFIVIIILVIIGIIAYFVYAKILAPRALNNNLNPNNSAENLLGNVESNTPVAEKTEEDNLPVEVEDEPVIEIIEEEEEDLEILKNIDTDKDGISDYDEMYVHFTDPFVSDTDSDELSDYEELFIIGTDPLNSDTDGDAYFDGQEIFSCYNPLGDGAIDISLFIDSESFVETFPELVEKCDLIIQ